MHDFKIFNEWTWREEEEEKGGIGHKNDEKKWSEVRGKSCKNLSRKCLSCIIFWTLLILALLICCQTQFAKGRIKMVRWRLCYNFPDLGIF